MSLNSYNGFEVFWDGGGSVRIRDNEFTVAVDPTEDFSPNFEAAIVLITGEEGFNREKLKSVCGRGTCVVLPEAMQGRKVPCPDVEFVKPESIVDIYNVEIEPLETDRGLCYRFDMRGTSFFASGDTVDVGEILRFENRVDLAFLSASDGVDLDEVIRLAVKLKPEKVLPYFYSDRGLDGFQAELEDRNISCEVESQNS